MGKHAIFWSAKYNYTPSTNLKADDPQIIGKQLIYVPFHSAVFNLYLKLQTINIGFDWAIRSQYYTNAAEQGLPLPGYSLLNFDINNTFLIKPIISGLILKLTTFLISNIIHIYRRILCLAGLFIFH